MRFLTLLTVADLATLAGHAARAGTDRLRVGLQYGLPDAQRVLVQDRDILTMRAREAGVPDLRIEFVTASGPTGVHAAAN